MRFPFLQTTTLSNSNLNSLSLSLSVPCPPANIQGSVNCTSGSASLTWDAMPNAVLYTGTAVGSDGHILNCSSSTTDCQLSGMHCGTYYNFSLSATDGVCASSSSAPYRLNSGTWSLHMTKTIDSVTVKPFHSNYLQYYNEKYSIITE